MITVISRLLAQNKRQVSEYLYLLNWIKVGLILKDEKTGELAFSNYEARRLFSKISKHQDDELTQEELSQKILTKCDFLEIPSEKSKENGEKESQKQSIQDILSKT